MRTFGHYYRTNAINICNQLFHNGKVLKKASIHQTKAQSLGLDLELPSYRPKLKSRASNMVE